MNSEILLNNFRLVLERLKKDKLEKEGELKYINRIHNEQVNTINGKLGNIKFNIQRQEEHFVQEGIKMGLKENYLREVVQAYRDKFDFK